MNTLLQDVRFGWRQLAGNPGFTAIAVIALALGIGANTAIFSVVNAVMLRPLPIHQPNRVVVIHDQFIKVGLPDIGVSAPDFIDLSRRKDVLANTAVLTGDSFDLMSSRHPERLQGLRVSGGFFPLMGVKPLLGRWLLPSEDRPGADHEVVLSEGLWKRGFGSDPKLIGKSIAMDGVDYTIIGIMPSSFQLPGLATDLWTPLALTPAQLDPAKQHDHQWLFMLARLRPGVTIAQAQAAVNVVSHWYMKQYKLPPNIGYGISVVPLLTDLIGDTGKYLFILLTAVGFVLLIACVNVANLALARASARSREMAVRAALGANRLRIVRQLLTESGMLAALGGLLGVWLAVWGVHLLKAMGPENVPRLANAAINGRVLAFTAFVVAMATILFGLAPALQSSSPKLQEALKEGGRSGSAGAGRLRLRGLLVIAEVALTLMLLAGSALMVKSFIHLLETNPGFDPHNLLTAQISLPPQRYSKQAQITDFYESVLKRVLRLPGVEAAGAVQVLPFGGMLNTGGLRVEGRTYRPAEIPHPIFSAVMPGYFRTMRIPLREGRLFSASDLSQSAPRVVIVDEDLAKAAWPRSDPNGAMVSFHTNRAWFRVVGVVGNVKVRGFTGPQKGTLYFPQPSSDMSLVIRTTSARLPIFQAVRGAVASVDPQQPMFGIQTMEQYISRSVSDQRLAAFLLGVFAALAIILAAIGIYGVVSYSVMQRTHEIGIRVALGASRKDVLKLVLRHSIMLASVGVGIGIAAALVLTRFIASLLYGVRPADPETYVSVSLALVGVALAASYIPARRAMKVNSVEALRNE